VIGRGRLTELRREMAVNEDGLVELLDAIEVVREQLISAQAASRASWQSRPSVTQSRPPSNEII
jgi:hypothetical protein